MGFCCYCSHRLASSKQRHWCKQLCTTKLKRSGFLYRGLPNSFQGEHLGKTDWGKNAGAVLADRSYSGVNQFRLYRAQVTAGLIAQHPVPTPMLLEVLRR